MNVNGHYIRFRDATNWFATREPLITAAKNPAEQEKRLDWLSQGILRFNLNPDSSVFKFGGDPKEKQMWNEFIQHLYGLDDNEKF